MLYPYHSAALLLSMRNKKHIHACMYIALTKHHTLRTGQRENE